MSALLDPRLADCRRIFLRNYVLPASIGWHEFEKRDSQRIVLNVDLFVLLAVSQPKKDDLAEVVDYDFVRQTIYERIARGHVHLQETLVDELAAALLAHSGVRAVRVATEKPDVYLDCEAVGVEVFRFKS
jgi:dihydroneopterin aldolase